MARTLDQLAIIANQIKDATLQGENTADRVGGLLVDLIDFLRTINVDEIALSPLLTALNESGLVDPQDGQILKFKSSEDNWVFSSDITQITSTIRTILDTLGQLDNRFVKKTGDIMTGLLTTLAGIKVRNFLQLGDRFVSGLLGEGAIFRENIGGRTYLEADEMYIRVKAYFDTVEIRKFLHSGGNRIASLGGAKCVRVEMLDSNNEVVTQNPAKYRCYFRASDGDDTITNDFVVGDQAYCHVTNATNSSLSMRHYWRLVIGKNEIPNENGEHWIDLSNQESETIEGIVYSGYLNISDAPAAQDDIIQLGNVNDSTRRGAIIEFVSGNDAPAYQIFQDLGSIGSATTIAQKHDAQYSYNGKNYISMGYSSSTGRAFMNVYGDFLFGDPEESTYVKYNAFTKQLDIKATVHFISPTTHQETTLDTFASAVTGGLESLQRQIDGEIDTWFYNGTPGPSVLPESEWVAIDIQAGNNNERLKHLGDLYYDNSTGYAYRYTNTGSEASPVFTWSQISDSAVIKALEDAAKAQDTADHKRRVFVTSAGVLPTPPYSEGDLWMNVTYPANATSTDAANNIYYNDILRCKVPATYNQQGELVREGVESGETALITHWQLSSKYTDDSKFNYFFTNTYSPFVTNIQQQVDRKAETWRQDDDPSLAQGWVPSEHVGDLWMDTNDDDQYGHKTFIYVDHGEGTNPRYSWEPQAVPDEVFDKIDGKAEIFVQKPTTYNERDMWIIESGLASTDMPSGCQAGDIVVADNMPSGITKRENSYVKGDWRKKDRYTDDTKVDNLLNNTYVQQLIGGSINQAITDGDAAAVQQAAQAAQTTYGYLTQALSQDTQITGGLILSSMIALRDGNGNMRSGISGTYIDRTTPNPEDPDEPYALGHGIAAWYGGENIDHEAFPALTNYAKSLFRFDGTGYLASGNISWDTDGALTIQGATLRAVEGSSTIEITTAQIASINWVNSNFISKAWFNKFFVAHYKRNNTDYTLAPNNDFPDDATDKTLESVFSFWTNYAISALGQGVDGSHAIGVLDDLNDVTITNPQTDQVLTYNGTHWVNRTLSLGSQTLADLTDVVITSPAANQMLSYDATTQKWVNAAIPATGVTSVALSMPTGFSITGSPITASGTFTVTFASGYSLPTTAKQTNWDTAYGWGNHASAGYALAANLGTASSHAHSDYLTSLSWDSTNNKLAWAKGGAAQTAITIGYASVAGSVDWSNVSSRPTKLSQFTNDSGFVTSSGVTSVATGTGLTGGTITGSGTISINSTYQTYISNGNTAYGWGNHANAGYVTTASAQTISGLKTITAGLIVSGRVYGSGDDEGIVITPASTNYATICLGSASGIRSMITLTPYNNTYWRFYDGTNDCDLYHPKKGGTIAVVSDLSSYLPLSGGTMTGKLQVNAPIVGYNYSVQYGTAAAFVFDKSGGNWTGIGANGEADTIYFSACGSEGAWVHNYKQIWKFNGNIKADKVQIGSIELQYDSTNNAIKVVKSDGTAASLYATGGLSALGAGQESGGGGDVTWALLASQATGGRTIHSSYISSTLSNYATLSSLSNYATVSMLSNYATISSLGEYMKVTPTNGARNANGIADAGLYELSGGSSNLPFGAQYGVILSLPYRKAYGNTSTDFTTQIALPNGDDSSYPNSMFYRTSLSSSWNAWQRVQNVSMSDVRLKTILSNPTFSIEQIANAPIIRFKWSKEGYGDKKLHIGSTAQYWMNVSNEFVEQEYNSYYSLQYGVAALISAITVARKVMTHEEKIALLETRVSALEKENGEQEMLINSLQDELAKFKAA